MLEQTILDFGGRDENTADLEHLIGSPAVPEVAPLIDAKLISRHAPVAREHGLGFFMGSPITESRGVSFYSQCSHLSGGDFAARGVYDRSFIAGRQPAQAAGDNFAGIV